MYDYMLYLSIKQAQVCIDLKTHPQLIMQLGHSLSCYLVLFEVSFSLLKTDLIKSNFLAR